MFNLSGKELLAGLVIVAAATAAPAPAAAQELRIGTASLGGAFYPVGQAIANLVNKHVEGHTMVPVVTQGAVENPRLVANGEVDLGISNASTAYFAYLGNDPYPDALDIRSIGVLHSSVLHIATLEGSPIASIADMRGARVAVGPAGGGTLALLRDLLAQYDLSMSDITPSFLSYADGFSQLSDGNVDVSIALSGYPASAVIQTSTTNNIAFIEMEAEKLDAVLEAHPYYDAITVPADVYDTESDIRFLGVNNILIGSAGMSEDLAYEMTAAIYGHLDEFAAENANALQIVPEESLNIAVPLHPGAQRYFAEQK